MSILGAGSSGPVRIDVERLIETRAVVMANSGGGKSWALRRLLEQTHGAVQQIVIDVEDEFATLREKYDYVLAGRQGGDCPADPRCAALLARRLLELRVSAIIGIYELKAHDRIRFVRLFLESLVDAPKDLWHPVMVVIDEAHMFAPEGAKAESTQAVIDLMTRGRKRGFCGILASQRPAMLAKDASAQANNKLIGRFSQDVDVKRAAEDLGFYRREQQAELRKLQAGHFFVVGPAFCNDVTEVTVGPVATTHPKAGQRALAPPPPANKVLQVLAKLADLPAEAEAEARTVEDLRRELTDLRRKLTVATSDKPTIDQGSIDRAVKKARIDMAADVRRAYGPLVAYVRTFGDGLSGKIPAEIEWNDMDVSKENTKPLEYPSPLTPALTKSTNVSSDANLGKSERAILSVLAQFREGCQKGKLTLLSGYRYSGGFRNSLSALRSSGQITGDNGGVLKITEDGLRALGTYDPLPRGEGLIYYWLSHPSLGKSERAAFKALVDSPGLTGPQLAAACDPPYEYSGGFRNALSALRTAGLIDGTSNTKPMYPNKDLFA